jgi:hypothetical protein
LREQASPLRIGEHLAIVEHQARVLSGHSGLGQQDIHVILELIEGGRGVEGPWDPDGYGLRRIQQMSLEAGRIVVRGIQPNPAQPLRRLFRPLHGEDRFAKSGPGDDCRDRRLAGIVDEAYQAAPPHHRPATEVRYIVQMGRWRTHA